MALIGTGQQRLVVVTPLLEGFSNLFASLLGGYLLGVIGVAFGTLVVALVGVGGNFAYNMQRTIGIDFTISDYLRDGLLRPAGCVIPVIVSGVVLRWGTSLIPKWLAMIPGLAVALVLVWHWGLVRSEREKLRWRRLAPQA